MNVARAPGETELIIDGMTCSGCARHVTEALQSVPGVAAALVSLEHSRATVRWSEPASADEAAAVRAVELAGYQARVIQPDADAGGGGSPRSKWSPLAGWRFNATVGLACTVPLMVGEWALRLGDHGGFQWLSFALATVVQAGCGARFYRGAWNQLKVRSANMDTLVALGSTTAYAYSVGTMFGGAGGHLYFMEAAAIITLISLGHWLEARVSERASTSLRTLLELAPATARQWNAAGAETVVPVTALKAGDRVALRPGDRVPVDGTVMEGDSAVDESMLTGESHPVDKAPGTPVYAGTINLNGRLVMRVTATGETTALAAIIRAVQRAQASRAGIQRLGDRVSSVFVPAVVLIALAAALWWGLDYEQAQQANQRLARFLWTAHPPPTPLAAAVVAGAAVLIIACPCAMGLATPAAIMASADAAARRGILIRDGVALEKAGAIDTVVFDKTGTLTVGRPAVAGVEVLGELDPGRARALAAALARHSTHPFSRAMADGVDSDIEIEGWREIRGAGLEGVWKGRSVRLRLGSFEWLVEGAEDDGSARARVQSWRDEGATVLGLALDGKLIALFALADSLKPGVAEVLRRLAAQGLRPLLVTGDSARAAAAVARRIGLAEADVFAEVKPEQKAGIVQQLQSRGARVAFVGDGINDGPALEQADLGVAVSKASDIAREAADIVLLRTELEAVPECIGLARATLRVIKQNLFWAFFYNALGIPLAALGFMSPVLCAAAMGLSDLIVIGNALRLRRTRR